MTNQYAKLRRHYSNDLKIKVLKEYLGAKDGELIKSNIFNEFEFMENYAQQINIPLETLRKWYYNKELIFATKRPQLKAMKNGSGNKAFLGVLLETELIKWIKKIRMSGLPINDSMISSKACLLRDLHAPALICTFSNGWLQKFKNRHNIVSRKVCATIVRNNDCSIEDIVKHIDLVNAEIKSGIYFAVINIDETGIQYDPQINNTLEFMGVERVEVKSTNMNKQRITVILSVDYLNNLNIKPFIIFKGTTPKCLKGVNIDDNYVLSYQRNSWCTAEQFILFLKTLPKDKNLLLIFDNFSGHVTPSVKEFIKTEYPLVKVITLPPNTTSILQPLDVAINKPFKAYIKSNYITWFTKYYDEHGKYPKLPKVDRNNLITSWINESWTKVCIHQTIKKSFNFCGYDDVSGHAKWKKFYRL